MEALIGIAGVVLGALAGTIATYLTTRSKMRWELVYAYDRELREKRLPHYQRLFHITRAVPREWRPDTVPSRDALGAPASSSTTGTSGPTPGACSSTQAARDRTSLCRTGCRPPRRARACPVTAAGGPLAAGEQTTLYQLASALRHQLSADVGTAQSPRLDWV